MQRQPLKVSIIVISWPYSDWSSLTSGAVCDSVMCRMPCFLADSSLLSWLTCTSSQEALQLLPLPTEQDIQWHPVSRSGTSLGSSQRCPEIVRQLFIDMVRLNVPTLDTVSYRDVGNVRNQGLDLMKKAEENLQLQVLLRPSVRLRPLPLIGKEEKFVFWFSIYTFSKPGHSQGLLYNVVRDSLIK